jgi:hypothetical protein
MFKFFVEAATLVRAAIAARTDSSYLPHWIHFETTAHPARVLWSVYTPFFDTLYQSYKRSMIVDSFAQAPSANRPIQ